MTIQRRRSSVRRTRSSEIHALADIIEATPRGAIELAAADSMMQAHAALARARLAHRSLTQREIAERLGVTEGRVSQVLSGEMDIKVSTLGRYLRALGFSWRAMLESVEDGGGQTDEIDREPRRGLPHTHDVYVSLAVDGDQRAPMISFVPEGFHQASEMKRVAQMDIRDVKISRVGWSRMPAELGQFRDRKSVV